MFQCTVLLILDNCFFTNKEYYIKGALETENSGNCCEQLSVCVYLFVDKTKCKTIKDFFFLSAAISSSLKGFLFAVVDGSPVSNVTSGWMDKTKDQINSFSCCLIACWEPKRFFFYYCFGQTFNIPHISGERGSCTPCTVKERKTFSQVFF